MVLTVVLQPQPRPDYVDQANVQKIHISGTADRTDLEAVTPIIEFEQDLCYPIAAAFRHGRKVFLAERRGRTTGQQNPSSAGLGLAL